MINWGYVTQTEFPESPLPHPTPTPTPPRFLWGSGRSKSCTLMSAFPSLRRIGWKWLQQTFALCIQTSRAFWIRGEGARHTNRDHREEICFKRLREYLFHVMKDKGHLFCLQWWKFQSYMLHFCHFCDIYLSDYAWQALLPIFSPHNITSVSLSPPSLCLPHFLSLPIKQGSAIASIIVVSNLFWENI